MAAQRRLPAVKIGRSLIRFKAEVIDSFIAGQSGAPTLGGCKPFVHKGPKPLPDRFWRYVDKSNKCWLWTGATNGRYGKISRGPGLGLVGAHRASWEIHVGPIPPGMQVLHRCDVTNCVRPDHLFLGTNQDNTNDKVAKGRHRRSPE